MNKIKIVFMSIFLFSAIFCICKLNSFALSPITPEINGFSNGVLKYDYTYSGDMSVYEYDFGENSAYNRYGMCCYYIDGRYNDAQQNWCIVNVFDLLNAVTNAQEPFAYADYSVTRISDDHLFSDSNIAMISNGQNSANDSGYFFAVWTNTAFTTDFPVFASKEKAVDYYRYGLLDEDSIKYGENYLADSSFDDIVYDPLQVPAPNVEWVADSNGHFTHKLHFLNNGYFGEHNTQLNYGLILSMHWLSVNNATISIYQNQGVYTRYQFTATDFCLSDEVRVYANPQTPFNFNDYACPPYLDLDQNGLCINGFNQMLSAYPINSRNFVSSSNQSNANFVLNTIKGNLDDITYKLNCPIVSCQYFVIDENNNLVKGPITKINIKYPNPCYFNDTGAELGYDDSEVQNWNPETDTPLNDPTIVSPPASPNPGPQSPIQIPDYSSVNAQDLVDNMQSIFGLVGQVPFFVTQLFNFLPDWLITFIAVSIGLVVAIGVIKLFLG